MYLRIVTTIFLLLTGIGGFAQKPHYQAYVDKHKDLAIQEMHRTGIPASIKLAQALLESHAGNSNLAREGNNHFGIKCGGAWNGTTIYEDDDEYDEIGNPVLSCFRTYRSTQESYYEHSEFLRSPAKKKRYGFLFKMGNDYIQWALGLQMAGYSTQKNYDIQLIDIIETYQLYQYDKVKKLPSVLGK